MAVNIKAIAIATLGSGYTFEDVMPEKDLLFMSRSAEPVPPMTKYAVYVNGVLWCRSRTPFFTAAQDICAFPKVPLGMNLICIYRGVELIRLPLWKARSRIYMRGLLKLPGHDLLAYGVDHDLSPPFA